MPYSHYHSHYHLPRMREMSRVYWCHSIGTLGFTLAAIFVPIYLLESGVSLTGVLLFALAQYGFAGLFQYPAGKLFKYISPHHLLVLGGLVAAVFFGLIASVEINTFNLTLLAAVWAFQHAVYWPAFHYIFGLARAHKRGNRQVAGLDSLIIAATTISPAVGGIIATVFGINYTYAITILLLFIASLPMMRRNEGPKTVELETSLKQIWTIRKDLLANICQGTAQAAESIIWPLFVFLIVASYAGVGILSSVIAVASVLVTLYVGEKADQRDGKPYIRRGLFTYSFTNIGRVAVENAGHVFGANLLAGVGRSLFHAPYLGRYYANSDGPQRLGYITAMETAHSLGFVLIMFLLLLVSPLFSAEVTLSIGLATIALTILGVRLIR